MNGDFVYACSAASGHGRSGLRLFRGLRLFTVDLAFRGCATGLYHGLVIVYLHIENEIRCDRYAHSQDPPSKSQPERSISEQITVVCFVDQSGDFLIFFR